MLPATEDEVAAYEAMIEGAGATKFPAQPSTSATLMPPPPDHELGRYQVGQHPVLNAAPGVAAWTEADRTILEAVAAQVLVPRQWVSPLHTLSGDTVTIPPYAKVAILSNPGAATLNVRIGQFAHVVPVTSTVAYPTLQANQVTLTSGAGTIIFSSDYRDAASLSSQAI